MVNTTASQLQQHHQYRSCESEDSWNQSDHEPQSYNYSGNKYTRQRERATRSLDKYWNFVVIFLLRPTFSTSLLPPPTPSISRRSLFRDYLRWLIVKKVLMETSGSREKILEKFVSKTLKKDIKYDAIYLRSSLILLFFREYLLCPELKWKREKKYSS